MSAYPYPVTPVGDGSAGGDAPAGGRNSGLEDVGVTLDALPFAVQVVVVAAADLPAADRNNLSDPLCIVEALTPAGVEVKHLRTSIIRANLNPTWDKSFRFRARGASRVRFRVIDVDAIGKDDPLGWCEVDLRECAEQQGGAGRPLLARELPLRDAPRSNDGRECRPVLRFKVGVATRGEAHADPSLVPSSEDSSDGLVDDVAGRAGHATGAVTDAARAEIDALRSRVDELAARLEEATRREREMAKKWVEEKKAVARAAYDKEKLRVEARVAARVATVVDKILDRVGTMIKGKIQDPDAPKVVNRIMVGVVDEAMPEIKEEVTGGVVGAIRTKKEVDVGEPIAFTSSPFRWLRAFVLYTMFPFDLTIWRKVRNPWWWVLTAVSLIPRFGVQQLWFLFILLLKDARDEYSLVSYIVGFKSLQFLSGGVIKTVVGAYQYWSCANSVDESVSCRDSGPTIEYFEAGFFGLQIVLMFVAFFLLPYSRKKGGVSFATADGDAVPADEDQGRPGCMGATRYSDRGGKIGLFVAYDAVIFLLACGCFAYVTFVNEATKVNVADGEEFSEREWLLKANLYWIMVTYSLLSIPWAVFSLPLLFSLLTHAKPTGYTMYGRCVALTKRAPEEEERAAAAESDASSDEERTPLLRRLLSKDVFASRSGEDRSSSDEEDRSVAS